MMQNSMIARIGALVLTLATAMALAQDASVGVAERFPAGSIQSADSAEQALTAVQAERRRIEQRYAEAEQACYPKFFAASCLDEARERRRAALARLRPVEVEANAFKRRARADERDKALAEKRAAEDADAADRARRQQQNEAEAAQKAAKEGLPPPRPAAERDRVAEHQAREQRRAQQEAADAPKRAANVASYEKKVMEAQKRQQEVAAKKAQKEKEKAAKAAAAASKP
jgi:colicin import membrane protein